MIRKPTIENIQRGISAKAFNRARKQGSLISSVTVYKDYDLYRYYPEKQAED